MPDFGKMRFNEDLIGLIVTEKRRGNIPDYVEHNKNAKIQSTIKRPEEFNSLFDWITTIKEDAKLLENSRIEREKLEELDKQQKEELQQERKQSEAIMNSNLKYYSNWLDVKFKVN